MKPKLAVGIGAAVVLAVALIVAFSTGGSPPTTVSTRITVTGNALPPLAQGTNQAVGQAAPRVQGTGLDGQPVDIAPGGGPMVVIFLAHWCPHCQNEVPVVQQWLNDTGGQQGLRLYAVATANDPNRDNYPATAWLEREKWTIPTILDDDSRDAAVAYGVDSFPFYAIIDSNGNVAARLSGELDRSTLERLMAVAATS